MKKLKFARWLSILLAAFLAAISSGCGKESERTSLSGEITVFSWEDYIDEDLLDEFKEEYGVKVNYYTFATNEEMYNEIIKDPKACDLVCPSEYMIMKMIDEGLIRKYDAPASYEQYGSPYIKSVFDGLLCGENEDPLSDYAIGYMWGTMGYIYNIATVEEQDIINWDGLLNEKYKGKSTIKDSVRDTYIMALAMVYKEELLALDPEAEDYNARLTEIFNRVDEETLSKVQDLLKRVKKNIYGFEVDSGKSDILTGKIDINFAWSGDAVYTLDEGDAAGLELGYLVPEEGSNVWFDGWVMLKDCEMVEEARAFLDFISRPENAVRNMDYIGYTSCVAGDEVFENALDWYGACSLELSSKTQEEYYELDEEEKEYYELDKDGAVWKYVYAGDLGIITGDEDSGYFATLRYFDEETGETYEEETELYKTDLKYFFDPDCTTGDYVVFSEEEGRQLYAQYSDEETINRCAVMANFDKETLIKINDMWNCIKLITLPTYAIILMTAAIVLIIAGAVAVKTVKKKSKKN